MSDRIIAVVPRESGASGIMGRGGGPDRVGYRIVRLRGWCDKNE
jgi:hypothetical protein